MLFDSLYEYAVKSSLLSLMVWHDYRQFFSTAMRQRPNSYVEKGNVDMFINVSVIKFRFTIQFEIHTAPLIPNFGRT